MICRGDAMQRTRVITHSGSDLSMELAKEYDITIVPDIIIFGTEELLNNVDINAQEFYKRLKTVEKLPHSAHPNIFHFTKAFEDAADCEEILCLTVTGKMSGSFNTANIVRQDMELSGFSSKITVYDSLQVSHGLGIMAMEAAILAKQGKTAAQIVAHLDDMQKKIGVYFILPSLKYAQMSGRVSMIRGFAADAIGIIPVLSFCDGIVHNAWFSRGVAAAEKAVFKYYVKEANYEKDVCIFHSDNYADAEKMSRRISEVAPNAKIRIEWVGAVIGIYTGSGTVGLAFEKKI